MRFDDEAKASVLNRIFDKKLGLFLALGVLGYMCTETVPAGHVKVGTLFGKVGGQIDEGLHFVNPLRKWHLISCQDQVQIEDDIPMPSQDQLVSAIDFSLQYKANCALATVIVQETGSLERAVEVILIPQFRSILREQGKGVHRAEDYFMAETQSNIQLGVRNALQTAVSSKGLTIVSVLSRNVDLPKTVADSIQQKKVKEQEQLKQLAELERYRTEQLQQVAKADAELEAAKREAETLLTRARAQEEANKALSRSLTSEILVLEAVRKWDGKLPETLVQGSPGNSIPSMVLSGKAKG